MKQYCGTDIIEVSRVKKAILETEGFKEKVFTKKEIEIGDSKSEMIRYQYYAGRFASKEAIYKALSLYDSSIVFDQIEITNNKNIHNRPEVTLLKDDIKNMIQNGKIQIDISISHIKEYATATAVVVIND